MKKLITLLLALSVVFLISTSTYAASITFIHEGSGSGTLNGIAFEDLDFTITAYGDTNNVESYESGFFINHSIATIEIDQLGTYTFDIGTRTFVNQSSQLVGFSRAGSDGADLFNGPQDSSFATWDMLTSIGPVSGSGYLLQWYSGVATNGGDLYFNNEDTNATFQAVVQPVPLPATFILFGTGLLGLVGTSRKKAKE